MRISKNPLIRRQEIIATAGRLFEEQSIAKTSMSDIAADMGVAKGLVYYYFASKDDLVVAVIEQFADTFSQTLAGILHKTDRDLFAKLRAVLQLYFSAIRSHPALRSITSADPAAFTRLREQLSAGALQHIGPIVAEGLAQGLIDIEYPEQMLRLLVRGLGDLYIEGVRDPAVHTRLIEQALGLAKGRLRISLDDEPIRLPQAETG
jgi:AcrR family transcriptional regulator